VYIHGDVYICGDVSRPHLALIDAYASAADNDLEVVYAIGCEVDDVWTVSITSVRQRNCTSNTIDTPTVDKVRHEDYRHGSFYPEHSS